MRASLHKLSTCRMSKVGYRSATTIWTAAGTQDARDAEVHACRATKRWIVLGACLLLLRAEVPARAEIDFAKDIRPILESSCIRCHSGDKPKGGLRLDTKQGLLQGGKSGKVIVPGKAADSPLYQRITLPEGEPDRMPPEGKPLSKQQTDAIRDWIERGAPWPEGLVLKKTEPAKEFPSARDPLAGPGLPTTDAERRAVAEINKLGGLAIRLAQNTNWLLVDLSLAGSAIHDNHLALLESMPNLAELDLHNTRVTDQGLAHLRQAKNLVRLNLAGTQITDAGLVHLQGLVKLQSLNLHSTSISDRGLEHLQGLKDLRRLYLWQTKVTEAGAQKLSAALPGLVINLGADKEMVAGRLRIPPMSTPENKEAAPKKPDKPDPDKKKAQKP